MANSYDQLQALFDMALKEATRLLGSNPKPGRNDPPQVFLVRPGTDAQGYQRFVTFSFVPTPEVQGQKSAEPVYRAGEVWYHVSVGCNGGAVLPTHDDMRRVRAAMFLPCAVVVQIWPPEAEYFNACEVLHLWQRVEPADRLVPDLRYLTGDL